MKHNLGKKTNKRQDNSKNNKPKGLEAVSC